MRVFRGSPTRHRAGLGWPECQDEACCTCRSFTCAPGAERPDLAHSHCTCPVARRSPLAAGGDAEGNQENDDADDSDDVRRHRDETRDIAGVCPDQSDDGADDQDGDHHRQPIQNPSSADDFEGTPMKRRCPS